MRLLMDFCFRVCLMMNRQRDSKGCPLPQRAFHSDIALMCLHNFLDDCQSQSRPTRLLIAPLVTAIESFKDMPKVLRRNPLSVILKRNDNSVVLSCSLDFQPSVSL